MTTCNFTPLYRGILIGLLGINIALTAGHYQENQRKQQDIERQGLRRDLLKKVYSFADLNKDGMIQPDELIQLGRDLYLVHPMHANTLGKLEKAIDELPSEDLLEFVEKKRKESEGQFKLEPL